MKWGNSQAHIPLVLLSLLLVLTSDTPCSVLGKSRSSHCMTACFLTVAKLGGFAVEGLAGLLAEE